MGGGEFIRSSSWGHFIFLAYKNFKHHLLKEHVDLQVQWFEWE